MFVVNVGTLRIVKMKSMKGGSIKYGFNMVV